jgi:hypothetical protein
VVCERGRELYCSPGVFHLTLQFWGWTQVSIVMLPLTGWVILGESPYLSEPPIPNL